MADVGLAVAQYVIGLALWAFFAGCFGVVARDVLSLTSFGRWLFTARTLRTNDAIATGSARSAPVRPTEVA